MGGIADDVSARLAAVWLLGLALAAAGCGGSEAPASREAERAFLQSMVPHHTAGAELARVGGRQGKTPFVRDVAGDIVRAKTSETRQMGRIHQRLFGRPLEPDPRRAVVLGPSAERAGMSHMDSAVLLRGRRPFDRAFVDEMVPHHRGAITVAEAVSARAEDEEIVLLAREIIFAQRREIAAMSAFRKRRYGGAPPG